MKTVLKTKKYPKVGSSKEGHGVKNKILCSKKYRSNTKNIYINVYDKGLNRSQEMKEHHKNEPQNNPKRFIAVVFKL